MLLWREQYFACASRRLKQGESDPLLVEMRRAGRGERSVRPRRQTEVVRQEQLKGRKQENKLKARLGMLLVAAVDLRVL